jgi:hypothetical protein
VAAGHPIDTVRCFDEWNVPLDEREKEIRFALAGHFLPKCWYSRASRIMGHLERFRTAASATAPAEARQMLTEMFLREGGDLESRVPSGMMRRLTAALAGATDPRGLRASADLWELIEHHAALLSGTVTLEAADWELELDMQDPLAHRGTERSGRRTSRHSGQLRITDRRLNGGPLRRVIWEYVRNGEHFPSHSIGPWRLRLIPILLCRPASAG